jgi:hypothetical protein
MPETLGRRVPADWTHVERYPYAAVAPPAPARAERTLRLPAYRARYDQGREGACVGFAASWMMSILNRRFYDAPWLWNQAKAVDEWPDTNPGDEKGTSVRAALDVLRSQGHVRVYDGHSRPPSLAEGIAENRWATSVEEIRTCVAAGTPVVLGCHWYRNFDAPERSEGAFWIGRGDLGTVRAGHAVCVYRVSDRLQAVGIVNNWGPRYPLVLMPYSTLERVLGEQGEAALVTDRP